MNALSYFFTSSPTNYDSIMKRNVNLVKIMLRTEAVQPATFLKKTFLVYLFLTFFD